MKTEYVEEDGCPQRESAEHEGYAEAYSADKTEEGSPQGGNLSPLLANIYLDRFDHEFEGRGVKVIRYADDIILMAKSQRAAERLLTTSTSYLENKLKLKVNAEKNKAVSVYSIRNFKFLGFALGRGKKGHSFVSMQSRAGKRK